MRELIYRRGGTVLTKDILFGINVLTLVGFLVWGSASLYTAQGMPVCL
jgi:hypothetical protein